MDEEEFYTVVQICDALKKTDVDISEYTNFDSIKSKKCRSELNQTGIDFICMLSSYTIKPGAFWCACRSHTEQRRRVLPEYGGAGCTWPYGQNGLQNRS